MLHLNTIDETMHQVMLSLSNFFIDKYGEEKLIFLKKSIVYFDEADDSEQPEILIKNLNWEQVKKIVYTSFISL
ncbi:MAG: hypothetical protein NVSMB7_03580 [Chitinophagaceae bacterium]